MNIYRIDYFADVTPDGQVVRLHFDVVDGQNVIAVVLTSADADLSLQSNGSFTSPQAIKQALKLKLKDARQSMADAKKIKDAFRFTVDPIDLAE